MDDTASTTLVAENHHVDPADDTRAQRPAHIFFNFPCTIYPFTDDSNEQTACSRVSRLTTLGAAMQFPYPMA